MLAGENAHTNRKSYKRDKESKIALIIESTRQLIQTKGYENVTIRDIAAAAGTSKGLIHKYFPGGKADVLKSIVFTYMDDLGMIRQPETVDFSDFPGYISNVIENMMRFWADNTPLIKASIIAFLLDGEIIGDVKKIDVRDTRAFSLFPGRFDGVDIGDRDPLEILAKWSITVHGILLNNMIFQKQLMSEEVLKNLLVDLSLEIWGYRERS